MDIVYELGAVSAADVHSRLPDPPTYTTVRGLLRILVSKGDLAYRKDGVRFVYRAITSREEVGASVLSQVIRTFFAGSPANAMAAMLGTPDLDVGPDEIERLSKMVRQARAKDAK